MTKLQLPLRSFAPSFSSRWITVAGLATAAWAAHGQGVSGVLLPSEISAEPMLVRSAAVPDVAASESNAEAALPEAPSPQIAARPAHQPGTNPAEHVAEKRTKTIPSDWKAQPLTASDKLKLGATDLYSFDNFAAMILSAGYEQITDGEPNYGVDSKAFGKRVGAAAIRETTQGVFTDMVFAPLLHEDPRYYVKGPDYNPVKRTIYSVTRVLVTRRDDGSEGINGHLLLGYAAAAALSPAYYPSINRNFHDVAVVYGGGVGGAALGFFIGEFSQDFFRAIHPHHAP